MQRTSGEFLKVLNNYINRGGLSRADNLPPLSFGFSRFHQNAERVCQAYRNVPLHRSAGAVKTQYIKIDTYQGSSRFVCRMINYLAMQSLDENIIGACVHGSLGTYEEVAYSDFDALVILRSRLFESPSKLAEVASKLHKAQSIMFGLDPLQHHGWFVLTEADLICYPAAYFPLELLRYAKSLFPEQGVRLTIQVEDNSDCKSEIFDILCEGIVRRIYTKAYPQNLYELKCLLSQFMLLPAAYLQKRDGKGVFKKFSFDLARKDFPGQKWTIMDDVSSLRENWVCDLHPWQKWIFSRANPISRTFVRRHSPTIPKRLEAILTDGFYDRMHCLAQSMSLKFQ